MNQILMTHNHVTFFGFMVMVSMTHSFCITLSALSNLIMAGWKWKDSLHNHTRNVIQRVDIKQCQQPPQKQGALIEGFKSAFRPWRRGNGMGSVWETVLLAVWLSPYSHGEEMVWLSAWGNGMIESLLTWLFMAVRQSRRGRHNSHSEMTTLSWLVCCCLVIIFNLKCTTPWMTGLIPRSPHTMKLICFIFQSEMHHPMDDQAHSLNLYVQWT